MSLVRTPIMQNTSLLTPTKEDYYKVSIKVTFNAEPVMSLGTGEIRSLAILLGPPVCLLTQTANQHMVTTRRIYTCRGCKDNSLKFKLSPRMGKNGDLSDFKRVVGAGQVGVCISGSADLLGIFTHNQLWGLAERSEKEKRSSSCVDENASLLWEVRGEWADRLEMIERQRQLKQAKGDPTIYEPGGGNRLVSVSPANFIC